jgi:hypothetical protein
MGNFQMNGGEFGSVPDPAVAFGGKDAYGEQGSYVIYGPYERYTMTWQWMSDTEFIELQGRVDGANGARVQVTIPITSSTAWATRYANVEIAGGWSRAGDLVLGVTLELTRVSSSL